MKALALAATASLSLLPVAADEKAPPKFENWTTTFIRTSINGKLLGKTRVPYAYNPRVDDLWGTTPIAVGALNRPTLWPVTFGTSGSRGKGAFHFDIKSSMLENMMKDDNSFTKPLTMVKASTTWQGPGRYEIFSWDNETFTVEILPPTPQAKDRTRHLPEQTIEFVRKDHEQKVLARASAPWWDGGEKGYEVRLPLRSGPDLHLVECQQPKDRAYLEFTVQEIFRFDMAKQVKTRIVFDLTVPVNDIGRYLIYAQDFAEGGETLEAIIRTTEPAQATD